MNSWSDMEAMRIVALNEDKTALRNEAIEVLFERHCLGIKRSLGMRYRYLSEMELEDFACEAFYRGIEKSYQFEGHSNVRTWLLRIAINLVKDAQRHDKVIQMESRDADENFAMAVEIASATLITPMSELELQQLVRCVQDKFSMFSKENPEPAWALWARFMDDISPQDIGELMGKKHGAMRQYLSFWATKLRRMMEPCRALL